MTLRLNGSISGYTEIDAPAVAGSNTLVLPSGNGSAGNILGTDGAGNLSWVNGRMVLETAKTATGTSVDFTGIPSWVKRVTVMLNGVSTGGTSAHLLQLGDSGGIENTGYVSGAATVGTSSAAGTNSTAGFILMQAAVAAGSYSGHSIITQVSENTWILSGSLGYSANGGSYCGGTKTLSDTLTQLRLTTVNGTDTFDAGSINLLLEG